MVINHRFLRFVPEKRDCKGTHNFLIGKGYKSFFTNILPYFAENATSHPKSIEVTCIPEAKVPEKMGATKN